MERKLKDTKIMYSISKKYRAINGSAHSDKQDFKGFCIIILLKSWKGLIYLANEKYAMKTLFHILK